MLFFRRAIHSARLYCVLQAVQQLDPSVLCSSSGGPTTQLFCCVLLQACQPLDPSILCSPSGWPTKQPCCCVLIQAGQPLDPSVLCSPSGAPTTRLVLYYVLLQARQPLGPSVVSFFKPLGPSVVLFFKRDNHSTRLNCVLLQADQPIGPSVVFVFKPTNHSARILRTFSTGQPLGITVVLFCSFQQLTPKFFFCLLTFLNSLLIKSFPIV